MADLTKEELRRVLEGLGERTNPRTTKVELRHRIAELTGEDMGKNVKGQATTLSPCQELIKELNKASGKKKADLITFCQDTLGLKDKEVSNKTIPQLQMVAMKHIMSHTPPHEMDLVNFGKYSDARYHEVLEKYPEYARWVKQTYQEGGHNCEARLQRLALWLEAQEKVELKPDETSKRGSIHSYVTSHKTMTDNGGASSSAASSSMETAMFQEMIGAIRELQKEVRGLKQEPARKKVMKSEESEVETDGSFMPVNRSP